jgi:outer membrane protein
MKKNKYLLLLILVNLTLILHSPVFAQTGVTDTINGPISLRRCVEFALRNQPVVRQASIDEQINEKDIRIGLSAWLPQLTGSGIYNYYFKGSPQAGAGGGAVPAGTGVKNLSTLGLQASQVIYNNDVLLAAKTAKYSRQYYKQNVTSSQINVVSDVSKAFFDVLLSQKQLNITNQDITRLQRSLKDAFNRYQAGVSDKTDYKQATISLNNSLATRKQTEEAIKSKTAYLKQIMGVDPLKPL